jgi:hypothetical protein
VAQHHDHISDVALIARGRFAPMHRR